MRRIRGMMRHWLSSILPPLASLSLLATPATAANSQADWEATIAAAKTEAALVISAPSGRDWRDQLLSFQKEYPAIRLEITPAASRDFWPRVVKEREAGQYLWDLRIGGPDAQSYDLKKQGAMAPIRPLLVLPEVADDSKWLGGLDGLFLDAEKQYFPSFIIYESGSVYFNRKTVPGGLEMKQIDDPQWKGKVAIADPRGGAALVTLGVMEMVYGDDFVRRFIVDQAPVVTSEPRQQIDWLASGRYPIAFGVPSAALVEYAQRGGRIDDFVDVPGLRMWSPGVGGIQMPTHPPHPNAAKLFINWLLTRDVQARLVKAVELNSRRLDVPPGAPDRAIDPKDIGQYLPSQSEEVQPYQQKAVQLLRDVLK
jgi:iron(III) transport system substrate-binding protein